MGLTFAGGGTLRAACGRSASRCWRLLLLLLLRRLLLLLLLLLLRRLLLLLLLLLRGRLSLLPLPLLLLPLDVKATRAAVGTVALALALALPSRREVRGPSCDVLLKQILLLGDKHGRFRLGLSHEAVLDLAWVHGQAGDLLIELAARPCNVLAKVIQQNVNKVLANK